MHTCTGRRACDDGTAAPTGRRAHPDSTHFRERSIFGPLPQADASANCRRPMRRGPPSSRCALGTGTGTTPSPRRDSTYSAKDDDWAGTRAGSSASWFHWTRLPACRPVGPRGAVGGTGTCLQLEAVAGPTGRAQSTARATRRGTRRAHRRPVVRYPLTSSRSPSCSVHRRLHRRWVSDGSGSSPTGRQQPRRDGRQGEQRPSLAGRGTGHPTPDGDPDGAFHELLHLRPGCVGADREHRPRTRRRRWGSARYASAPALERDGCLPRRRRQDRPIRGQTACDGG